jgi:hypothetical protein
MKFAGLWTDSKRGIALLITSIIACAAHAERINQEGRILGPAPTLTTPMLFNMLRLFCCIALPIT